ncbi:triphosphoribosyl-dephospho-CoA synthase CitG [Vibrio cincinnatiensis]|uniref:triphosphoribosyl-dephospho-CoA synthase CitG n=1 Tax=Vibrio cincinnatiensis TaxID=675 RepID=UPI0012ACD64B|nr:triphosphoribosyl-dephospho-CoA synthase CitG [Vibrio cincinnatiensis]
MTIPAALDLLFELPSQAPCAGSAKTFSLPRLVGHLAYHAMMLEVHLTPKPGLVDTVNNGAHRDMDLNTFILSAEAIAPYLQSFVSVGWECAGNPAAQLLTALRPIGIEAEQAMFAATQGVNTHKGMIFILGLICGSVGWLKANQLKIDAQHIGETIRQACQFLVIDELKVKREPETAGERIYRQYGLTGARGEAASGLAMVMRHALPAYQACLIQGASTEQALWHALLVLMANNNDSNLAARGGLEGLRFVQDQAQQLLAKGGFLYQEIEQALSVLDNALIEKDLSPGGSADLLAATWLVNELVQLFKM